MRTISALLALLAIAALALASDAFAQTPKCYPLESVISANTAQVLAWQGIVQTPHGTARMMLFQSPEGRWTIFVVHGVMACAINAGRDGEAVINGLPI